MVPGISAACLLLAFDKHANAHDPVFLPSGRVDAVVQSTDKNFMVPVGGSVVAAGHSLPGLVNAVNQTYPGSAAVGAHLDLLITLLHWGARGWKKVSKDSTSTKQEGGGYLELGLFVLGGCLGWMCRRWAHLHLLITLLHWGALDWRTVSRRQHTTSRLLF